MPNNVQSAGQATGMGLRLCLTSRLNAWYAALAARSSGKSASRTAKQPPASASCCSASWVATALLSSSDSATIWVNQGKAEDGVESIPAWPRQGTPPCRQLHPCSNTELLRRSIST